MYKIIVENTDIINYCNNITWNNDADTLGTQLNFDSIKDIAVGSVVSLFNESREIFRGIAIKPSQKRWTWGYTCQDYSFYLKNKVIKQFNNISASEAIKSLLGEAYIVSEVVDIPTKITKIYKSNTIAEIIDDILEQAKADQGFEYFKEIESNVLYIRKLVEMKINPNIFLPKDIQIDKSMENMKNRVQVISNKEKNTAILATAEDSSQQWFYGLLTDIQSVDDKNIAQAQNIADNALKESNKIIYSSSFEVIALEGGDDIKANRMIYLKAGSRLDGYYKIKSAKHTLTKGLHKVNISIEW